MRSRSTPSFAAVAGMANTSIASGNAAIFLDMISPSRPRSGRWMVG